MSAIALELVIILALVLFNGLLAMSEMALVSARKVRLQRLADEGSRGAREALTLAGEPARFLSTVQIGITLVGILAGAFGGATLAEAVAARLARAGLSEAASDALGVVAVVLGVTYLSLVAGELAPKRLAMQAPELIAARVARPMRLLAMAAAPAVAGLSFSTELVFRVLRVRPAAEAPVSEEEVKLLIQESTAAGVFEAAEEELVSRIFRLGDLRVSNLMTPRTLVSWIDLTDPPTAGIDEMLSVPHTAFPACDGSLDSIAGVITVKDLWAQQIRTGGVDLRACLRPPLFIPESVPALRALEHFKRSGAYLAIVLDEFGGTAGLITITDIIEAIAGELPAEDDTGPPAVQRDDGSWLLDGRLPLDHLRQLLAVRHLPDEDAYQTLAGFVMYQLGHVPREAEQFTWNGARFEVVDMDGNRIDRVLLSPAAAAAEGRRSTA